MKPSASKSEQLMQDIATLVEDSELPAIDIISALSFLLNTTIVQSSESHMVVVNVGKFIQAGLESMSREKFDIQ